MPGWARRTPRRGITPPPLAPTHEQIAAVQVHGFDDPPVPDRLIQRFPNFPGQENVHPDSERRRSARDNGIFGAVSGDEEEAETVYDSDSDGMIVDSDGARTTAAGEFSDTDNENEGDEDEDEDEGDMAAGDLEDEQVSEEAGGVQNSEDVIAEEDHEEPSFDPVAVGLREISNLASFTVSSYKPGNGVKELRDDDCNAYWQSDGPQPHRLNIHFIKRVEIRALRLHLDYELDESYTPTKIQVVAGTGPNLTVPFATLELSMPKGWIDVPIVGAGGGADGNSLCCWFVRVIVLENHQNGKDTHLRGIKVYALDEAASDYHHSRQQRRKHQHRRATSSLASMPNVIAKNPLEDIADAIDDYGDRLTRLRIRDEDKRGLLKHDTEVRRRRATKKRFVPGDGGVGIPDFMREPEIR